MLTVVGIITLGFMFFITIGRFCTMLASDSLQLDALGCLGLDLALTLGLLTYIFVQGVERW